MGLFQCQPFCEQNTAMRPGQTNIAGLKGAAVNHRFSNTKQSFGVHHNITSGRQPFGDKTEAVVYEVEHPDLPGTKIKYEVNSGVKPSRHQGAFCGLKPVNKSKTKDNKLQPLRQLGSISEEASSDSPRYSDPENHCCNMAELVCSHYERLTTAQSQSQSQSMDIIN